MSGQPKLKVNDLVEQLNVLVREERRNEFELASFRREAEKLIHADPLSAHLILGMIASLDHRIADMRRHHEIAVRLDESNILVFTNYATSLRNTGYYSEARNLAEKALELAPQNPYILLDCITNNVCAFRINSARERLEQLTDVDPDLYSDQGQLVNLSDFSRAHALADGELEMLQKEATRLVQDKQIYHMHGSVELVEDEEAMWVTYTLRVDELLHKVVEADFELAEILTNLELSEAIKKSATINIRQRKSHGHHN